VTSFSTHGIVLRKVQYTGNSFIVNIYTRQHGMVPFLIRGVSGKNSRVRASTLQVLSRVEISYDYREKSDVQIISSISLNPEATVSFDEPEKTTVAFFIAEVLHKTLREESPDEDLFAFIDQSLEVFYSQPFNSNFHLIFLLKLTRFFGFFPSGQWNSDDSSFDLFTGHYMPAGSKSIHSLNEAESRIFYQISISQYVGDALHFNNTSRRSVLAHIVDYYRLHVESIGEIKSLNVLTDVFAD
jgi:DNA repair protein RecO (recombination protein O)